MRRDLRIGAALIGFFQMLARSLEMPALVFHPAQAIEHRRVAGIGLERLADITLGARIVGAVVGQHVAERVEGFRIVCILRQNMLQIGLGIVDPPELFVGQRTRIQQIAVVGRILQGSVINLQRLLRLARLHQEPALDCMQLGALVRILLGQRMQLLARAGQIALIVGELRDAYAGLELMIAVADLLVPGDRLVVVAAFFGHHAAIKGRVVAVRAGFIKLLELLRRGVEIALRQRHQAETIACLGELAVDCHGLLERRQAGIAIAGLQQHARQRDMVFRALAIAALERRHALRRCVGMALPDVDRGAQQCRLGPVRRRCHRLVGRRRGGIDAVVVQRQPAQRVLGRGLVRVRGRQFRHHVQRHVRLAGAIAQDLRQHFIAIARRIGAGHQLWREHLETGAVLVHERQANRGALSARVVDSGACPDLRGLVGQILLAGGERDLRGALGQLWIMRMRQRLDVGLGRALCIAVEQQQLAHHDLVVDGRLRRMRELVDVGDRGDSRIVGCGDGRRVNDAESEYARQHDRDPRTHATSIVCAPRLCHMNIPELSSAR